MAYGEFYGEYQCWARFPKVLIMCRKHGRMENGNCAVERKRYVIERTCCIEGSYYDAMLDENRTQLSCDHETSEYKPNYCPYCGAKVVYEKKGLNNDGYNYNDKFGNIEHCDDQHGKCCN